MECYDDIIKSVISGNKDNFRQIVDDYQLIVFAACYSVLRDYQEAENAAQETFIQVYRSLHTYEFKGFKTWMLRIATNKSIDIKRLRKREEANNIISLQDNDHIQITDGILIEDEIIKTDENERLKEMCLKLPHIYGEILNKYYIQSKSYEEISIEDGISIRTVESRLYRGKKILRENFEEGAH